MLLLAKGDAADLAACCKLNRTEGVAHCRRLEQLPPPLLPESRFPWKLVKADSGLLTALLCMEAVFRTARLIRLEPVGGGEVVVTLFVLAKSSKDCSNSSSSSPLGISSSSLR